MTDKQIIIDGVDVSGCKHYKNRTCIADYCLTDMPFGEAKCELNPNCHYKQLKRKEKSEEKLVKQIQTICDFINTRPETFKGINGSVDKIITDYAERKEQECEELKAKCKKYGEINEQETKDYAELKAERDSYIDKYFLESQKVVNLRKVLREIKEIARVGAFYWKHYKEESKRYNEILQKISEVEDEEV